MTWFFLHAQAPPENSQFILEFWVDLNSKGKIVAVMLSILQVNLRAIPRHFHFPDVLWEQERRMSAEIVDCRDRIF